jgi:hypothetical protein
VIVAIHLILAAGAASAAAQVRLATLDDTRREVTPGDLISIVQTTGRFDAVSSGAVRIHVMPWSGRGAGLSLLVSYRP